MSKPFNKRLKKARDGVDLTKTDLPDLVERDEDSRPLPSLSPRALTALTPDSKWLLTETPADDGER